MMSPKLIVIKSAIQLNHCQGQIEQTKSNIQNNKFDNKIHSQINR